MAKRKTKLTQDQTKLHNRRLVLRVIYEAQEVSRAGIARATGLTRTTTSHAVAELMADGLVVEGGQGPSAGGKPPRLLHFVDDARLAIGVDVSGYAVQGSIYDLRGRPLHHLKLPVPTGNGKATLQRLYDLLDRLVALIDRPLLGVGLGVPGFLDTQEGVIHQAVNLGWHELPLGHLLRQRYSLPVFLVNDSQAAALAQYTFANENKTDDLTVLLVGRGISAGLVIHGQLYCGGCYSGASEIGHLRVVDGGELCACGHYGCLETVASQDAIVRWAKIAYQNHPASGLRQFCTSVEAVDMEAILQAYRAGDPKVAEITARVSSYLGIAAANLTTAVNIPLVVLAGSVTDLGNGLASAVEMEMKQRLLPILAERTNVKVSELGEGIVMQGAAALLLANELGVV